MLLEEGVEEGAMLWLSEPLRVSVSASVEEGLEEGVMVWLSEPVRVSVSVSV